MTTRKGLVSAGGRTKALPVGDSIQFGRVVIDTSATTTARTLTAPDKSGTLATTDDIPASPTLGQMLALSTNTPFV